MRIEDVLAAMVGQVMRGSYDIVAKEPTPGTFVYTFTPKPVAAPSADPRVGSEAYRAELEREGQARLPL